MRFVVRQYANKPKKLTLATTLASWNRICTTADTKLISESIYRDGYNTKDGTASRVIDKLNRWYLYKCAYCERIYKLDVEHYRPKGEVKDQNNAIVQITPVPGSPPNNHPGYYWLCYEWSNLIPSCLTCNRPDGKSSKFPTINHYEFEPVFNPAGGLDIPSCFVNGNPLLTEQPYIINPEIDDPGNYFVFKVDPNKKGIRIVGIDSQNRGDITADICKLNRDEVKYDRVNKVILPIKNTILTYLELLKKGRKNLDQFRELTEAFLQKLYDDAENEELDHTLLRKFIVINSANFRNIVLPFLPRPIKKIVYEAFHNYTPL